MALLMGLGHEQEGKREGSAIPKNLEIRDGNCVERIQVQWIKGPDQSGVEFVRGRR